LTCGTPTQDCLRWANDKYKGILAFRATLRNSEQIKTCLSLSLSLDHISELRLPFFASSLILEPLSAVSCTVPILGRQLLM
jgi:hypothetical protein